MAYAYKLVLSYRIGRDQHLARFLRVLLIAGPYRKIPARCFSALGRRLVIELDPRISGFKVIPLQEQAPRETADFAKGCWTSYLIMLHNLPIYLPSVEDSPKLDHTPAIFSFGVSLIVTGRHKLFSCFPHSS